MVRVEIAVYDLLPPGKLSTAFYYAGVGIYHTAVRIPDLQVEVAYGGLLPGSASAQSDNEISGIFTLPSPENPAAVERMMPGVRFIRRLDVGEAFGSDWVRANGRRRYGRPQSVDKPLPPTPGANLRKGLQQQARRIRYERNMSSSSSTGNLPLLSHSSGPGGGGSNDDQSFASMSGTDEFGRKLSSLSTTADVTPIHDSSPLQTSPQSYYPGTESPFDDKHSSRHVQRSGSEDSTMTGETWLEQELERDHHRAKHYYGTHLPSGSFDRQSTPSELLDILAIIDDMKAEPAWRATRYHLLARNCNNFTSELCYRLTGRYAPNWMNRAAWLGQILPCLVPEGWLDPPTLDDIQSEPHVRTPHEQTHTDRPTSPLITIPYVQTKPLHVDVQYESVRNS